MDEEEGVSLSQGGAGAGGKQPKFLCLRCRKNVTKTQKAVRCSTCQFWVHADCQGIPKDLYAYLRNASKVGGLVAWSCDCCAASAARLTERVVALETATGKLETRVLKNEGALLEVEKRMDKVEKKQDKVEETLENERERIRVERVIEMREIEIRKRNVLIHRLEEAGNDAKTVEERKEWDICSCDNMFKELHLEWGREAIKFCRRIGERSDEPRPLVVGFFREFQKEDLLDRARDLRNTPFAEVGVLEDLTQEQRRDEVDLAREAEKRNETLTNDEKAKNLKWLVVGRKGEKRLMKGTERGGASRGVASRGRSSHPLPMRGGRGGAWGPGGSRGGQRGRGYGSVGRGKETTGEREDLLELVRTGSERRTARINSKRTREGDEEEMDDREQPPHPASQAASQEARQAAN